MANLEDGDLVIRYDDTIAKMAYLNDASGHLTKMGRLLHDATTIMDLDSTIDGWFTQFALDADAKVDLYKRELNRIQSEGIKVVHFFSDEYPPGLREIGDPPIILYIRAETTSSDDCIAISGSRNPSSRGYKAARETASSLSREGFTIAAGLARGVDLDAHLGALEAGGRTLAVLPSAIIDIYPKEHSRLAEEIAREGMLVSEMSSLERMDRLSFIRRNRITTGLARCLVVGESDGTGGTLQQFKVAMKQGRPVFAIRPNEDDRHALKGFSRFVKGGAIPIDEASEVVDGLKRSQMGQVSLGDF